MQALERNKSALNDAASRLVLIGSQKKLFELALDLAFISYDRTGSQEDLERFLQLSEANRSILLKSRLNEFAGIKFTGVPDSILAQEQALLQALDIDPEERGTALDLDRKEQDYHAFLLMLEKRYPRYFELRYGEPRPTLKKAREALLVPDRQLLVYVTTEEHLYTLVIGTEEATLVRSGMQGIAREVGELNEAIMARDGDRCMRSANELYERTIRPVAKKLDGAELLVVPDGPLHLVNFEMLIPSLPRQEGTPPERLIHRYTISYLLSVTTAVQFTGLTHLGAQGALAVAPGFTDQLKRDYLAHVHDSTLVDQRFLALVRQPFAVRTAIGLGDVLSAHVLVGAQASELGFREQAGKYGILHLGTHADMNAIAPMYSYLVFDKDGDGVDADSDGYLHAYEIFDLDLRAELAVLTACGTGIGKQDPGEGIRSLAYGFAFAGCPSLVMSLWNIDERSSSEVII